MINKICENITNWMVKDLNINSRQTSAIKYGLESIIGTLIETVAVFLFAYFIGTLKYAIFLMVPSFFYRMFADGPHCTSYKRCFTFTFTIYLLFSFISKHLYKYANLSLLLILVLFSIIFIFMSYNNMLLKNVRATILYLLCANTTFVLCWLFTTQRELAFAGIIGLSLQSFISTPAGYKVVKLFDLALQHLKID